MGLGAGLASAGMISEGVDQGQLRDQAIAQQRQRTTEGQIGLEDLQRTQGNQAAERDTVSAAGAAGKTPGQTLDDLAALQVKQGRFADSLKTRDLKKALWDKGFVNMANAYMQTHNEPATDPKTGQPTPATPPVPMPELKRFMPELPGEIMGDNKGNITYTDPETGKSATINAGHTLWIAGAIKPLNIQLPGGSSHIYSDPVTGETKTVTAPSVLTPEQKDYWEQRAEHYKSLTAGGGKEPTPDIKIVKDEMGRETLVDQHSGAVGTPIPPTPGKPANPHTWNPFADAEPAVPGTPGDVQWTLHGKPLQNGLDDLYPKMQKRMAPGTPSAGTAAPGAPQQGETPPAPGAKKSPKDGQWYVADPNNPGKFARVNTPGQPQAAPAAPTPQPAPQPAATRPAPTPAAPADDIPQIITPAKPQTPMQKHGLAAATAKAELASQPARAQANRVQRTVQAFRDILKSGQMTPDDAVIIQDAIAAKDPSGKSVLTPQELDKGRRMLSRLSPPQQAHYAKGGLVTRYGL